MFFNLEISLDSKTLTYIQKEQWNELLEHCFETKQTNLFKYVYLHTDAAFPVDRIKKTLENCTNAILDVSGRCLLVNVYNEESKEKTSMTNFIANLKGYSVHFFKERKCYYQFHYKRYKDRIHDLLRECSF
jgi:hypothetical protein